MSGTVLIFEDDTRIANWVKVYFEVPGSSPRFLMTANPVSLRCRMTLAERP